MDEQGIPQLLGFGRRVLAPTWVCAALIFAACAEEPPPVAVTLESAPSSAVAPELAREVVAESEAGEFVVHFGSFDDRESAFRYLVSLPGSHAERTAMGRFLVVTEPMDRASADDLVKWQGGRVLTVDYLRALKEDY